MKFCSTLVPLALIAVTACGATVDSPASVATTTDASTSADDAGSSPDATTCANAATSSACVDCCRLPQAPNYGGFELYAYDVCQACPGCAGMSPCGMNDTPPADRSCVTCLQAALRSAGLGSRCKDSPDCSKFAVCLLTCPVR